MDKHSTGGVGDKITLPLAPLVAACGAAVPQLSGRGLGHTGGTLDKLESIPGWRADLAAEDRRDPGRPASRRRGLRRRAPTWRPRTSKLYALRDVTGTVESIPLIASSIMSKKIAEGTGALVLDVKVGSGAFMKNARRRARTRPARWSSSATTPACGTVALLTAMDTPAGPDRGQRARGRGVAGGARRRRTGRRRGTDAGTGAGDAGARPGIDGVDPADELRDGTAMDRWRAMIAAQGGDPDAPLPTGAAHRDRARPDRAGVLTRLDAMAVGLAAWRLGAGRARQGEPVQAGAGVELHAQAGRDGVGGRPAVHPAHRRRPDGSPRASAALAEALDRRPTRRRDRRRSVIERIADPVALTSTHDRTGSDRLHRAARPRCCCTIISTVVCGPATVLELAHDSATTRCPPTTRTTLAAWFREAADSGSLVRYLETFDHTVAVMQTPEGSNGSPANAPRTWPTTAWSTPRSGSRRSSTSRRG